MTTKALRWARKIGILAALAVPAFVVAQQRTPLPADGTFSPNQVLRADQLEGLRDTLADAVQRINQLENASIGRCRFIPQTCTTQGCEARCPNDVPVVKGGGCDGTGNAVVRESRPNTIDNGGWICEAPIAPIQAYALCCPQ